MQYHQLGILCALRDKIAENDKSLTGHQAMDRARARMTRLGSGSLVALVCAMVSVCSSGRFETCGSCLGAATEGGVCGCNRSQLASSPVVIAFG